GHRGAASSAHRVAPGLQRLKQENDEGERMGRFVGLLGLGSMIGLAYLFSTDRKAIRLSTVLWGLSLQISFAFFVLRFELGRKVFQAGGDAVNRLLSFSYSGSEFVFGEIGKKISSFGFSFAFQVLPTILFIAAFFAVLYHIRLMQVIIRGAAWLMTGVMGEGGGDSANVAGVICSGHTEATLA